MIAEEDVPTSRPEKIVDDADPAGLQKAMAGTVARTVSLS
jgi:hypothetical protein